VTIIQLVEAVAAETMSYDKAMASLDLMRLTEKQWADAEMALRLAAPFTMREEETRE
jgi:hypothetical protein